MEEGPFKVSISVKLNTLRCLMRETVSAVSNRSGVSRPTLSKFFSGSSDISANRLIELLKSFDIDLNSIVQEKINELAGVQKRKPDNTIEQHMTTILEALSNFERRTLLETLMTFENASRNSKFSNAIKELQSRANARVNTGEAHARS